VFAYWDTITAYESNSAYNGAYTAGSATDPAVTSLSEAITNKTNVYAIVAKLDAVTSATVAQVKETQTTVFPIQHNAALAPVSTLKTGESIVINVNSVSVSFAQGANNGGTTVSTVSDMISYIDGATNWGSSVSVAAANEGYERAMYRVNFSTSSGVAAATSAVGADGKSTNNNKLWWNAGGAASGTIDLGHASTSADIAEKLAAAISAYQAPTGNYPYNATYVASSDDFSLTTTVSKAGYPSSIMPNQSFPSITFTLDAAETSTTVRLRIGQTVSNSAAINSDTFLSVAKTEVPGLRITLTNNTNGALFGTATGDSKATVSVLNGVVSTYAIGDAGKISTSATTGLVSALLASGTHHSGSSLTKLSTEMSPSSGGTVTQAACATDRTGWLG